jgi:glucose-1-phosphate cytidylyltransferase
MGNSLEVIILAGGLGTRLQEETILKPKPMVKIGRYPMLLHIMSIYIDQGFSNFIVSAGYKAEVIREYFGNFDLYSKDVEVSHSDSGGLTTKFTRDNSRVSPTSELSALSQPWHINIVDTGLHTTTAGRILGVKQFIKSDHFMCTYGDGVADINLKQLMDFHLTQNSMATVTAVHPPSRFGELQIQQSGTVTSFQEKPLSHSYINGGFFVFNKEVINRINASKTLEEGLLSDLSTQGQLSAYVHNGFWQNMDTVREMNILNGFWDADNAPWLNLK